MSRTEQGSGNGQRPEDFRAPRSAQAYRDLERMFEAQKGDPYSDYDPDQADREMRERWLAQRERQEQPEAEKIARRYAAEVAPQEHIIKTDGSEHIMFFNTPGQNIVTNPPDRSMGGEEGDITNGKI